jgi:hypothetical protein
MRSSRFSAAFAGAAWLIGAAGVAAAQTTMAPTVAPVVGPTATAAPIMTTPAPMMMTMAPLPAGKLALDARGLRARRTATGFVLSGQAEVNDACQAARFDFFAGNIFPPQFNANQFRRPGTLGLFCAMRLTWVTVQPRAVRAMQGQRTVTVLTKKGATVVRIQ